MSIEEELNRTIRTFTWKSVDNLRNDLIRKLNKETTEIKEWAERKIEEEVRKCFAGETQTSGERRAYLPELNRAGVSWSEEEDQKLDKEISYAIDLIATAHERSYGAIATRLRQHAEDCDKRPLV